MKKILSLLSMLMITVMAFATDYKGQLDYILTTKNGDLTGPSYAQGTLKIEPYAGGKYTVTATGCDLSSIDKDLGNWDEIICEGVEGTTDANGVTTIDVTHYAYRSSDYAEFKSTKLFVKFKGDKAYATFEGTYNPNFYTNYKLKYTFGVDEGFDGGSTGGGETKEKYTVNFDKTAYSIHSGRVLNSFSLQQTGKEKQTESVSASRAAYEDHTSKKFTVEAGSEVTASFNYKGEWMNGYVYIDRDNDGEFSYNKGQWNQEGTDLVAYSFYTTLDDPKTNDGNGYNSTGASVTGNARNNVNPPAFTAPTEPGTYRIRFKVDWNCILPGGSNDILSYGGGVWDATLEVVAPAPTVNKEVPFTGVAFTVSNSMNGNADVTFKEMSDETVQMTFASSSYNISATNLTKDTDAKGRTTYTGTAVNDAMSTVTYTVNAVVYDEGTAQKLYMTLVAADGTTFTVGEDPDYVAPVTYKNTLYVVENAKLLVETADAEVVLQDKGGDKYDVTLPAFTTGEMTVPSITFEATKADNKLTASNVSVPDVYSGDAAVVTMNGTFESDGKLFASLTVKCGSWFDYEVGYGIKPFVATTKEYTAEWANVKVGDAEPVNFQKAKVDYTEFAKGQYSLTYKDLTIGDKKIGDFTIKYVHMDKMGQLSTTAAAGTWTRVEAGQDVASLGDEASISGFEGVIVGTGDGTLFVKFTINAYGTVAVDFGHKYKAPEVIEGTVVEGSKDYAANGSKFEWSNIAINWNKQKLVAVIDLSSCTGTSENILSVGQNIGSWSIGGWHFYYTVASKKMKSDYLATDGAHPVSDPKTGVEPGTVRIELSKAEGCTIDGVSYNALYDSNVTGTWQSNTEDFWNLTSVNIGSKEGANRSNAVIKYVTVVDLPVTVKDEKTFNEALYMVQGTTPLKIADSKVVVKEMTDETINMSLTYTIGDSNVEYTSTELTKGTDAKGRTTYTGKVAKDAMTFDVAGVVYEKDNVSRLYMTMTATNMNIVVGENPDTEVQKPVVYKNTLKVVRGTDTKTYEDAEVSVLAKGEGMYEVTLPKFSDMDNVPGELGPITFQAKGVEENGKVVLTATDQEFTLTNTGWKNDVVKVSMKGEIESEMLKATFNVNHSSMSGYNYTLYYGVEAPEVVTEVSNKTYKSNLRIADQTSEDENAYLFQTDEATVNIIKYSDKTYKITLKQITLNSKTSDLVFTGKAVESEVDPGEGGVVETEGTMVQATADAETQNFLGGAVNAQFMWQDVSDTEIRMSFVLEGKSLSLGGKFNYEKKDPDTPDPELFSKENYVADGTGFEWDINVDWDTQKIVMSIDPSTCTGSCEDVIGLGAVPTAWDNTLHLYRTSADQMLQGYFNVPGGSNNNTNKFAETAPFLVEVSKAQGFVVNNEVKIASSAMSYLFTLPTVKMGTGEGANDKSRATYNYVKVVDKDWTAPKDPDTGINATTVAEGEVEFFTVNGVKLNKLQKGLNIVRTADGKVKKVLVK